jgi:hypothetical protein
VIGNIVYGVVDAAHGYDAAARPNGIDDTFITKVDQIRNDVTAQIIGSG